MEDRKFKKLSDGTKISDLKQYILEFVSKNPDLKIYVGTDSQNIANKTIFGSVIVFHNSTYGGHVLVSKQVDPKFASHQHRLWTEVEMSIQIANFIRQECGLEVSSIDLDLNPDPKYHSNTILRAAVGYVEGMGFTARTKPEAIVASHAADITCR